MGSFSVSLEGLNSSQHRNICLAAGKLDGVYVLPGHEFSFNKVVGSRSLEKGFVLAGSLYEGEVLNSLGGGICLTSSVLYNAILRSCLEVKERVSHKNLVRSVPAGLDATVWYGVNDFKFINNTPNKIKIESKCSFNALNITIKGRETICKPEIITQKEKLSNNILKVKVFRRNKHTLEKISEDVYAKSY